MSEEQKYEAVETPYACKRNQDQPKNCYDFNCYEQGPDLGKGAFGRVIKVFRSFRETEDGPIQRWPYACKILDKKALESYKTSDEVDEDGLPQMMSGYDLMERELEIYKYLDCRNICKLFEIIFDELEQGDYPDKVFCILQYCDLGELLGFDYKTERFIPNFKLEQFIQFRYNIGMGVGPGLGVSSVLGVGNTQQIGIRKIENNTRREELAKVIFKQVFRGVKYLHDNNVINRDIKPENILCKSYDDRTGHHIKLADFSLAKKLESKDTEIPGSNAGTLGFKSPEQLTGDDYNPYSGDIFALGVSLYCYVTLRLPWNIDKNSDTPIDTQFDKATQQQEIPLSQEKFGFSRDLADLIDKCCRKKPEERFDIYQVLNHRWLDRVQF